MPTQAPIASIELAELQEGPDISVGTTYEPRQQAAWLVIPDWWAALIPGGFDYCNARNAPRFALLVGLCTLVIIAYQSLVRTQLDLVIWRDTGPRRSCSCMSSSLVRAGLSLKEDSS